MKTKGRKRRQGVKVERDEREAEGEAKGEKKGRARGEARE